MNYKFIVTAVLVLNLFTQIHAIARADIVPYPISNRETGCTFTLPEKQTVYGTSTELRQLAEIFIDRIIQDGFTGFSTTSSEQNALVKLQIDSSLAEEAYLLDSSTNDKILIKGGSVKGVWWGLQTLEQLLFQARTSPKKISFLALRIEDWPRFAYRGAHLDCCRHFFTVEEIKSFIDLICMHKINNFHWHLTDDQGWRIEIRRYPELTRIGSQRQESVVGHHYHSQEYDGIPHGGFYTQEQVRDVVAYAAARQVTIIPEIEMPGHAQAALASYPQLGCKGENYKVWTRWGISEEIFCVGKESTFEFLENVLAEVCDLFPGEYIHIGGDEAPRNRWKECPYCQQRIQELSLGGEAQLQSYLVSRIEAYLNSKNKKIIGWDEILEGGVSQTATIMSWRGVQGGIAAARQGNDVIMTPCEYFYLDYYQTDNPELTGEPLAIGGSITLEKCYSFDPATDIEDIQLTHLKGLQANTWTEDIADFARVQHMLLPRLAATAEIAWSRHKTDFFAFRARLRNSLLPIYEARGYNYADYEFR